VAVKAWRKVQVLRPSSSTSGGQSECNGGVADVAVVVAGVEAKAVLGVEELWVFVIAAQDAKDVQERQLGPILVKVNGNTER
jgi:hypothetical protein